MTLTLFAPERTSRHEIDFAISVQLQECYNGIGKCSLVLPMNAYNSSIAKVNALLYVLGFGAGAVSYEIVNVQSDESANEITLNGYTLNAILDRRVVASPTVIQNIELDVYAAMQANLRGLPVTLGAPIGLAETTAAVSLYGEGLLSSVLPVLASAGLGQRAEYIPGNQDIIWQIYKGRDLTSGPHRVVFSSEYGSTPGLSFEEDISGQKNVCYCAAKYRDETAFVVSVGGDTGTGRRELWIEFSGEPQTENETNAAFAARVRQYAALQLGSHRARMGCSFEPVGQEYGSAYSLGDLVTCVSIQSGIRFNARIAAAVYAQDANGASCTLTLGDTALTVMEV